MAKTLKRPLSVLLALLMVVGLFTAVPFTASAEEHVHTWDYDHPVWGTPTGDYPEDGQVTVTINCTGCDQIKTATANVSGMVLENNPSCGNEGSYSAFFEAVIDGHTVRSTEQLHWHFIPAEGEHYPSYRAAVAPTYNADGNVEYWQCMFCDKMFADEDCTEELTSVTIPALAAVAQVNGVNYGTLEEAAAAAPAGATITLLSDIDFSEVTKNRNAHDVGQELKIDLKDCTLDLDGHTIKTVNASVVFTGAGATIQNGSFALVHVKKNSTAYQAGSYGLCLDGYNAPNASINLSNLTVEGGINVWNRAMVTIDNVTATTTASKFYAVWAEGTGTMINIVSGTFTDAQIGGKGILATGTGSEGGAKIIISGGTFNAANAIVYNCEENAVEISGGTFNKPVADEYCAVGYIPATLDETTGQYSVKPGAYVAKVGDVKYETLQEAVEVAAPAGRTITLLADVDFSEVTKNRNAHDSGQELKIDLGKATLDLNGYTITTVNASVVFTGEGAMITNGSFALNHIKANGNYQAGSYGLCIDGYDKQSPHIVLSDLEVEGGINIWKSNVVLNDVTATTTASKYYAVWAEGNSIVTIYSGTFTDTQSGGKGVLATGTSADERGAIIIVKGGTFNAGNKIVYSSEENAVQISGGTFSKPVDPQYCAEGFLPKDNGNGTYGVTPKIFVGHNIALDGNIHLNFFINPSSIEDVDGAVVKFSCDKYSSEMNLTDCVFNGMYYMATYSVPAAYMAHNIHAELHVNGAKVEEDDYSVQQYAETMLAEAERYVPRGKDPVVLTNLMKEMLNYGAKAQEVFKKQMNAPATYNTIAGYTMANVTVSDIDAAIAAANGGNTATVMSTVSPEAGASYYTTSLIFLSESTLRHYFKIPNGSTMPSAYAGNQQNYYYWVEKTNIPAAELDKLQEFNVNGLTFSYSALDYAKAVLGSSMDQSAKDLVSALYLYNQAANAYFD